jgi:hypothetical protein
MISDFVAGDSGELPAPQLRSIFLGPRIVRLAGICSGVALEPCLT